MLTHILPPLYHHDRAVRIDTWGVSMVIMEHEAPKGSDRNGQRVPEVLEIQSADQHPAMEEIDYRILDIFRKYPSKKFKAYTIQLLLEYQGIRLGYGKLRYRLQVLTILSLVHREKGKRVDRYTLVK